MIMTGGIFLIQNNGELIEMREQPYDSESILQKLLEDYPNLLAGDQMNQKEPRRWLLVSREACLPSDGGAGGRMFVDHLFLDQDAVPTIVEVKRSSDTRIRREVVGQMLDYAANAVVYWPIERLRSFFEDRCRDNNADADMVLSDFLGPDADTEDFWQKAKTNLHAGNLRLLFVADEIPVELKRIVEFLNDQMERTEVLAVEIKQFAGEGLKTLVPKVIGLTAEAQQKKSGVMSQGKQWDEESFFEEIRNKLSLEELEVARKILEWSKKNMTRIWWGKGKTMGSFVPVLEHNGVSHQLFAVYTTGPTEIYFQWYQVKEPFDSEEKRLELLNKLNSIPKVSIPKEAITKRPSILLKVLAENENADEFIEIFDWVVNEIIRTKI